MLSGPGSSPLHGFIRSSLTNPLSLLMLPASLLRLSLPLHIFAGRLCCNQSAIASRDLQFMTAETRLTGPSVTHHIICNRPSDRMRMWLLPSLFTIRPLPYACRWRSHPSSLQATCWCFSISLAPLLLAWPTRLIPLRYIHYRPASGSSWGRPQSESGLCSVSLAVYYYKRK